MVGHGNTSKYQRGTSPALRATNGGKLRLVGLEGQRNLHEQKEGLFSSVFMGEQHKQGLRRSSGQSLSMGQ